jgi:hypothetical protein
LFHTKHSRKLLCIAVSKAGSKSDIGRSVAYIKARQITNPLSARGVVLIVNSGWLPAWRHHLHWWLVGPVIFATELSHGPMLGVFFSRLAGFALGLLDWVITGHMRFQ